VAGTTEPWAGLSRRELLGLAALLLLGALLLARRLSSPSLEFDEGVYLLSADLLSRGYELGREVFTSQPPLFMWLLSAGNWLVGGDAGALRGMTVLIALGGAVAGWAIIRRLAGPLPALAAIALIVVSPGVVDAAAVVSADVPCVALGTGAMLAARLGRRRPWVAATGGALLACALLVKLLAAPFAVAIAVAAIVERPSRAALAAFVAGAAAVVAAVGLAYADVLGELWAGAVGMHLEARGAVEIPPASMLAEVILIASAYVGLALILAPGIARVPAGRRRDWLRSRADLIAALTAGIVLVAAQRPLLHHHLVVVAWPLALLAASTLAIPRSRPAVIATVIGGLLLAPLAVRGRDTLPVDTAPAAAAATLVERRTPADAVVVSDMPLVPLLADRRAPPALADPSYVRVETGSMGRAEIVAAARRADAVVVGRSFALVVGLGQALERRFGEPAVLDGVRVYFRA
jgi:4-amino-4-deoxy-L-arabinose transferase-like glycosyltransferase